MAEKKYSDEDVRDAMLYISGMVEDAFKSESDNFGQKFAAGMGAFRGIVGSVENHPDLFGMFARKFREVHE